MKTKIQLALTVVIVTICLTNLSAQNSTQVPTVVGKSFANEFKGATYVHWSKANDIFLSRFEDQKENCLAYFAPDGQLLLSGREIPIGIAPRTVRKEAERLTDASKKKYGFLEVSKVYEVTDSGETMYYIDLSSSFAQLSAMVHGNGHSQILNETSINNKEAKTMIASKEKK